MGHNGVVSSYMISTDILRVDGLSTGSRILGRHISSVQIMIYFLYFYSQIFIKLNSFIYIYIYIYIIHMGFETIFSNKCNIKILIIFNFI